MPLARHGLSQPCRRQIGQRGYGATWLFGLRPRVQPARAVKPAEHLDCAVPCGHARDERGVVARLWLYTAALRGDRQPRGCGDNTEASDPGPHLVILRLIVSLPTVTHALKQRERRLARPVSNLLTTKSGFRIALGRTAHRDIARYECRHNQSQWSDRQRQRVERAHAKQQTFIKGVNPEAARVPIATWSAPGSCLG